MPQRHLGLALATGLAALALTPQPGQAQVTKPAPGVVDPARVDKAGPASTTLYLFLRTGAEEDEAEVLITLNRAVTKSGSRYAGKLKLNPVSPTFYEELLRLVDQAAPAAPVVAGEVSIRRILAQGAVYEIAVGPRQLLTKLSVVYKSGAKKEYVPAAPSAGEAKPGLVLIVPGKYAFTPEPGDVPVEHAAEVSEAGKPAETKSAKWPVPDKHYVVTMDKFEGNRELLFAKMSDKIAVGNAFAVKRSDDLLFAFASLNASAENPDGDTVTLDSVTLSAENLKSDNVRRAWAYFPLDAETMKEAVATFRDKKMNSEVLCQEIRKNAVKVGAEASVKADEATPRWYELALPPNDPRGRFSRTIKADSVLDLAKKYGTVGKLIVWEFDDGVSPPVALMTQHPDATVGKVLALDRLDAAWQANINQLRQSQKKDKDK